MISASAWPRDRGRNMWRTDMRHGGAPSARLAGVTVFSRLSRRRHIDLKRSASCLCRA
ncbi:MULTISPECIES: putative leader peptide [unclassified Streptomyces]|uniref:putative leader peptide n=1 Tax=unclassified Streptomyces TaxID=2593676 RepID=UPI002FF3C942